jgi:quercetin dioxygenase-like cupin family protein
MELNADFSKRVSVHAADLPWVPSPTAGVERRMLDRIGDEVARATSIVRYAPNSAFPAHTHGGGEEFLVLEGVFEDESGAFPAGSYVRNPPQSRHTPGSTSGCTIFVKLWQFDPDDRAFVRLDTASVPCQPVAEAPGISSKTLFERGTETVRMQRWAPHARVCWPDIAGGAELLVLDGSFEESSERFSRLSWLRLPTGATLEAIAGLDGAEVWVKTGHLSAASLMPPQRGNGA